MKQKFIFGILIFTLILLLLGWVIYGPQTPVTCSQIEEVSLRTLGFNETDVNELLNWLEQTGRAPKPSIYKDESSDGAVELNWQGTTGDYYARFYDDTLVDVHINWRKFWYGIKPTGKEVVDCLGNPDLYYAEYGPAPHGYGLLLDLWYLKKGIVVRGIHFSEVKQIPFLDENLIMTNIHFLSPGSADEMNSNIAPKGYADYPANVLRPWPDEWAKIVIDNQVP